MRYAGFIKTRMWKYTKQPSIECQFDSNFKSSTNGDV